MNLTSKSLFNAIKTSRTLGKTLKRPLSALHVAEKPSRARNPSKLDNVHLNPEFFQSLRLQETEPVNYITSDLLNTLPNEEKVVKTIYPRPSSDFRLQNGEILPKESLQIKYATYGKPELGKPVLLLCPSMSNSVFAMDSVDGEEKGWWRGILGKGDKFGINIDKFFVVVGAPLGSPFGSTSPLTLNPSSHEQYKSSFPQITPRDQAKFQKLLLDSLGIDKVHTVIGGSMGGMQTLQFAVNFPDSYDNFVAIASTGQTSPGIVALRSVQREIVKLDVTTGMKVARMMGTIFYRSHKEFVERFDWTPDENQIFEVEKYLHYQGEKFLEKNYDVNCWLVNSKSMDLQNIALSEEGLDFEESLRRVSREKKGMLLSYSTDRLTPPEDHERIAKGLDKAGVENHFEVLESRFGHDAFLIEKESEQLNVRLRAFLNGEPKKAVQRLHYLLSDVHYP